MKIAWYLDAEEPIDPENLVGDITLSDAHATLHEHETYIDSWLDACITGLYAVQEGKTICVDVPEEPHPLVFEPVDHGMRVSYRTMAISAESVAAFRGALLRAAAALLQQLEGVAGWERNPLLQSLRNFVGDRQEVSDHADKPL